MKKTKIFISYSSKESKTAEKIHKYLDEAGFEVWRDQTRLETDWSREIAFALADSHILCLLWSEHSANSKWINHEWLTARALEKRIIPCLFQKAPSLPLPINNLHGVTFSSFDIGIKNLIERIIEETIYSERYEYTILPENSYIPFKPNEHFIGRHTDLLELYLKMIGNINKIGINQVGTVGMGGIGKTQLAVEFAFRFSYGFNAIYWIQAANPEDWLGEFVSLARDRLGLKITDPDKPEANKQYIYELQKYFKKQSGTLVIMDNVPEPKLLNNDVFLLGVTPLSLGCDLLFTTRKHFEIDGVLSQPVNVLSPDSAFELIKSYRQPETKEEEKHARSICNIVGYLPLAITLAGAYLRKYKKDYLFADYCEELVKKRLDVIDIGKASEEDLATRHIAAVTATLESQWAMLKDKNSRHLFKLAGQFLEATIIPKARLHLLSGIKQNRNKLDNPFIKAFNYLQEICLMEQLTGDTDSFSLHPLVREFSYNLVTEHERASFRNEASLNLKNAYFDYRQLEEEVQTGGIQQVIDDIQVALSWWGKDDKNRRTIELLQSVMLLSSHVLLQDPSQLYTQLIGRLLKEKASDIKSMIEQIRKTRRGPCLYPLTATLLPPNRSLIRTITGFTGSVVAVAVTPDGKQIVAGSDDCTIKVWDLETGAVNKTLKNHSASVKAIVVTPDGKKVISAGSNEKTIKVWDMESGTEIGTFEGHSGSVNAIAVTPDGKRVVSGSDDFNIKVWEIETGKPITSFTADSMIYYVAVAYDGKTIVAGDGAGQVHFLRLEGGGD